MHSEWPKTETLAPTCRTRAAVGLLLLFGCGADSQQATSAADGDARRGASQASAAGHTETAPAQEGVGVAANGGAAEAAVPAESKSTAVTSAAGGGGTQAPSTGATASDDKFSFFVTSYAALQRLSKNENGFGGDLRYGAPDGLSGADKICREIAEASQPGAGSKTWRAFLSVTKGPDGAPVHAIDRIGNGPWYDRLGRLLAASREDLLSVRPKGGDPAIVDDFPNEDGVPNHAPDGVTQVDNHDVLTGTDEQGQLFDSDWKFTCHDWTSSLGSDGTPRVGHSWPRSGTPVRRNAAGSGGADDMPRRPPRQPAAGQSGSMGSVSGDNWMSALNEAGCAAGASLVEMGGPKRDNPTVGSGGGYGAIYCFVLTP